MLHGVTISDAELQTAWEKQKEMFVQPEQVEISQITVDSAEEMKKVQSDLGGNADFALVARTRSEDQFKDQGGKVPGPLQKRLPQGMPVPQEAADAAFKMKPGQISDPIKVGATWVVVRLENKIPEKQPKLEDYREPLRVQLRQQKAQQSGEMQKNQQALQKAQQAAKVEINRPEYSGLMAPSTGGPGGPGGPSGAPGGPAQGDMPPAPPGD
jgi:parvulin-like peptidyl-prolyl isomerase